MSLSCLGITWIIEVETIPHTIPTLHLIVKVVRRHFQHLSAAALIAVFTLEDDFQVLALLLKRGHGNEVNGPST